MTESRTSEHFHALLIGINCYLPNLLPGGLFYKSLSGCVQDVGRVEAFLRNKLNIPAEQIIKLTSSNVSGQAEPSEPPSQWPTYKNIVDGFKRVTDAAQPGDQVFIHYSGHGGRASTTEPFKPIKGEKGLDEVLVPMDLGNSEGNYLRDTELNCLLKAMVDKGLLVTIVLDSCHAGGAMRAPDPAVNPDVANTGVRGIGVPDTTVRDSKSLVASADDLVKAWQSKTNRATRSVKVGSGWNLDPEGYVLVAACRANEYANEIVFEGSEKNGALSYWFIDSLNQLGPAFTYSMLHGRVLAKVHSQFTTQTPQLEGEGDRVVFSGATLLQPATVPVLKSEGEEVVLNAGRAHGVDQGSQFAIFENTTVECTREKRIGIVEVIHAAATESRARLLERMSATPIEAGAKAIRLEAGTIKLGGKVKLVPSASPGRSDQNRALQEMRELLSSSTELPLTTAGENESADYLVSVRGDEFVICDPSGNEIPNLRPALRIGDAESIQRLAARLTHLVKYNNVHELDNNDPESEISRKLIVELVSTPPDYVPNTPVRSQPLDSIGRSVTLRDKEWAFLRIRNEYSSPLNITVLNLQPDWGISQIYPIRSASFEPFDPQREVVLPLHVTLPNGYEQGRDIIKVFATIDATDFHALELPVLDQPNRNSATRSLPRNPLERFLSHFPSGQATRTVNIPVCAAVEWCTHQVEIEISAEPLSFEATA
jgi:hypothetical protein